MRFNNSDAVLQFPHHYYCQQVSIQCSMDHDMQSTVAEAVQYAKDLIIRQTRSYLRRENRPFFVEESKLFCIKTLMLNT